MDVTVTVRRGLVIGPDLSNCFSGQQASHNQSDYVGWTSEKDDIYR